MSIWNRPSSTCSTPITLSLIHIYNEQEPEEKLPAGWVKQEDGSWKYRKEDGTMAVSYTHLLSSAGRADECDRLTGSRCKADIF